MKVRCKGCKETFDTGEEQFSNMEERLTQMKEENFACPHCNEKDW